MSEKILKKLQELNSLLWVLDLDKADTVLNEIVGILRQSNDPFYSKMVEKYKRTYNALYIQLNQPDLILNEEQEYVDKAEQEYGHFAYSDDSTSSLLIIKNRFELEARVVMTDSKNLRRDKDEIIISSSALEASANRVEESETALVFSISFIGDIPRFGEITFTHSGIVIGRIFSNQYPIINDNSISVYKDIALVVTGLSKEIYGITKRNTSQGPK